MKAYVKIPLISLGLGAVLLMVSLGLSGSSTVYWNGVKCAPGSQYGFPLPLLYSMNRSPEIPPSTHSTSVCTTRADIMPLQVNLSNALDDYLFWFVISLAIVFGLNGLARTRRVKEAEEKLEQAGITAS